MSLKKGGLGKGLDAIFMENEDVDKRNVTEIRISDIEPNKSQPRNDFDEEALAELADSIAKHGVLQPLLVRKIGEDSYQIVAGERRWRACRMAGIKDVPVIIKDLTDAEVMQIALIENLQREDLTPIEEAFGYKSLIDKYNFTQEEVSKTVGKSRPAITNALRLLLLPKQVIDMISKGEISAGHARALLSLENTDEMICIARIIIEKGLSVRDVETLVKKSKKEPNEKEHVRAHRSTFFDEVELSLKDRLGRKIRVLEKNNKKGFLQIEFYSEEDLAQVVKILGVD